MPLTQKFFSLDEAEKLIPKLEPMVENLIQTKKSAMEIAEELADLQREMRSGKRITAVDLVNKQTELDFLVQVINEGLEKIEQLGAQPKDIDLGLIDFPTLLDGEEMLLCWKYGEKSIRFYHNLTEGFAGRKPLVKD